MKSFEQMQADCERAKKIALEIGAGKTHYHDANNAQIIWVALKNLSDCLKIREVHETMDWDAWRAECMTLIQKGLSA